MSLPFELPTVSAGFALLTPAAAALGERAAREVGRALSALTLGEVAVTGRPLPCVPAPVAGAVRLRLELCALPGTASLELDSRIGVALLDRLCGGPGVAEPATCVTPLERSALELAVLAALDAVATIPELESRLAPRLARAPCGFAAGLAVELAICLGDQTGRARLVLPAPAVRALREGTELSPPMADVAVDLSVRGGSAPLLPEELDALEPGDVVLLDPLPPGRRVAVAPGGLRLRGTETDGALQVEEIQMPASSSDYPVALEVELARLPVTLGDLAALAPGSILPLPIDRRGLVALKLGDRTFARGQLVDVEGTVGVRIDSIEGNRP